MTSFRQLIPGSHRWAVGMIGGACLVAGIVGTDSSALGQDPSALAPADVISARKTLMNAIACHPSISSLTSGIPV